MDEYSGNLADPVSLHKYTYASANPVMYTDPTGYFSMSDVIANLSIRDIVNKIVNIPNIKFAVDAALTVAEHVRMVQTGQATILEAISGIIIGVSIGYVLSRLCVVSEIASIVVQVAALLLVALIMKYYIRSVTIE